MAPTTTRRYLEYLRMTCRAVLLSPDIKRRDRVDAHDQGPLRRLADSLGERWAGGAIVYTGDRLECLDETVGIWAVPVHRLLT